MFDRVFTKQTLSGIGSKSGYGVGLGSGDGAGVIDITGARLSYGSGEPGGTVTGERFIGDNHSSNYSGFGKGWGTGDGNKAWIWL